MKKNQQIFLFLKVSNYLIFLPSEYLNKVGVTYGYYMKTKQQCWIQIYLTKNLNRLNLRNSWKTAPSIWNNRHKFLSLESHVCSSSVEHDLVCSDCFRQHSSLLPWIRTYALLFYFKLTIHSFERNRTCLIYLTFLNRSGFNKIIVTI